MNLKDYPVGTLMDITARPDVVFVKGEGSWLWDHEGRKYLDFVQGWAVNCLGHSPRVLAQALTRQAQVLITPSPAFFNEPSIRLATALTGRSCFDQVFFANTGAEANEGAIKLARKFGAKNRDGAYEIITFQGAFHGRTLATMSASGKPQFEALFEPKVPGFPKAQLNDLASVERLITDKTIGVMLEPIQGEAGVLLGHRRVHARPAQAHHGARAAAHRRRGADRRGTHRQAVGLRARRHRAGHHDAGQGHRRRRAAGGAARQDGGVLLRAWRPGRDLQRQSADVRRGPGRARGSVEARPF